MQKEEVRKIIESYLDNDGCLVVYPADLKSMMKEIEDVLETTKEVQPDTNVHNCFVCGKEIVGGISLTGEWACEEHQERNGYKVDTNIEYWKEYIRMAANKSQKGNNMVYLWEAVHSLLDKSKKEVEDKYSKFMEHHLEVCKECKDNFKIRMEKPKDDK